MNGKLFNFFCFFRQNLAALATTAARFFSARSTFLPDFCSTMEQPPGTPPPQPPLQQANPRIRGRSSGVPNYHNDILIDIVEQQLPQGLEAWRKVDLAYQMASKEVELCRGENIRDNWVRKLCNNFKRPTGRPGELHDRIYCCMEIERRIKSKANAAILGVSSAKSDHVNDQRSRDDSVIVSIESIFGDNVEVVESTVPQDYDNDRQVEEGATV